MTDNIEKHVLEAARDAYAAQGDLRRRACDTNASLTETNGAT